MTDQVVNLSNPTVEEMRTGSRSVVYRPMRDLIAYQQYVNRRESTRRSFLLGRPKR